LLSLHNQAKETADDLLAEKNQLDAEIVELKKQVGEAEIVMKSKCSTIGNVVGKDVPVSQTEVSELHSSRIRNAH